MTHDEFPCHCLLQTWWYPGRSNLVLICDCGELLSICLSDSSQPITIVSVGVMMAIRRLEAHVKKNSRQETPTKKQLQELDYLKDSDLFETTSKILNIPMEVKKIRANMTARSKHSICRSTAECTVRISWTVEQELSSELL